VRASSWRRSRAGAKVLDQLRRQHAQQALLGGKLNLLVFAGDLGIEVLDRGGQIPVSTSLLSW
jgi:hypothetical protein